MSATVVAVLKKVVTFILTDKKARRTFFGILLGVLVMIFMPIAAVMGIFNGSVDIDTDRLSELISEQQSTAAQSWAAVETAMTEAGYEEVRIEEAKFLFTFALYGHISEADFSEKLVGCFALEQTDEQLISNINSAFGTDIDTADFTAAMESIRYARSDTETQP